MTQPLPTFLQTYLCSHAFPECVLPSCSSREPALSYFHAWRASCIVFPEVIYFLRCPICCHPQTLHLAKSCSSSMLTHDVPFFEETPLPLAPHTQATTKTYHRCLPLLWTPTACGFLVVGAYHAAFKLTLFFYDSLTTQ